MPNVEIIDFVARPGRLDGMWLVTVKQITDERGTIHELFRRSAFEAAGLTDLGNLSQINITTSRRGAVRGMHAESTTKLLSVAVGEAVGGYVDLRPTSPTFGMVDRVELMPGTQVLLPSGVANGFQALVDGTQYVYCFDREWAPDMDGWSCSPLDPNLAVAWPIPIDPVDAGAISVKDREAPMLADVLDRIRQRAEDAS